MKKPDTAACRDFLYWEGRLYAYAEGEAPPDMREAVEAHVRTCAYCKTQLDDIQFMIRALRTETPTAPVSLHTDIMDAVEDAAKPAEILPETADTSRRTDTSAETPLLSMVRTQTAARKKQARIRFVGGLAAACVIAVGIGQLLPLLPAMRGVGSDTGDASKILTDLGGTGDGAFVDGVFVGGGSGNGNSAPGEAQTPHGDRDAEDGTAEENVLGAILNIFSDKSEEAAVKETDVPSAHTLTLTVKAGARDALEDILRRLMAEGSLSYTETDAGYLVTLEVQTQLLLDALADSRINVQVSDDSADTHTVEIIFD